MREESSATGAAPDSSKSQVVLKTSGNITGGHRAAASGLYLLGKKDTAIAAEPPRQLSLARRPQHAGLVNDITRFQFDIGKVLKPSGETYEVADGKRYIAEDVILQNEWDVDGAVYDFEMAADFGVAGAPAAKKRWWLYGGQKLALCKHLFLGSANA